jgi:lactoylglutathione lyase
MLMVADMDRATAFYRDALGLHVRYPTPDWTELCWADAIVALHTGGSGAMTRTGLGFEVDDLDAALASVQAFGGRVVKAPTVTPGEPIRLAEVADPEGNVFSLAQPTWER